MNGERDFSSWGVRKSIRQNQEHLMSWNKKFQALLLLFLSNSQLKVLKQCPVGCRSVHKKLERVLKSDSK